MLSLTKCKKKLNKNGVFYTADEVLMIRDLLYKFAEVYYNHMEKKISDDSGQSHKIK